MTYYTKTPMTNTHAIWILEERVKCNKEEKEEAIQLAIKALKQYGALQEIRKEIDDLWYFPFNVAMENYQDGYYFTEKICNCFASRVVPIYYGCPNIGEYFDTDGIVICDSPDDVIEKTQEILKNPEDEYNKRISAIEDNFARVQKYRRFEPLFMEMYADKCEILRKACHSVL